MKIEVERFSDKRLKMKKTYGLGDTNVRKCGSQIDIVPKIGEVELEKDVLEAVNIWNLMHVFPELKREIEDVMRHYFRKKS